MRIARIALHGAIYDDAAAAQTFRLAKWAIVWGEMGFSENGNGIPRKK